MNTEDELRPYVGKKGVIITRFKGLGEMNPIDLEYAILSPETRKLDKICIGDYEKAAAVALILLGPESQDRMEFMSFFMEEFDQRIDYDI